jgi:hypothetical protein
LVASTTFVQKILLIKETQQTINQKAAGFFFVGKQSISLRTIVLRNGRAGTVVNL